MGPSLGWVKEIKMVAFTGMPGAGKSEAVRVAKERGFQVLRMGDEVWDEVRRRGLPLEAAEVGRVADDMRTSHGPDVWARRTLERVDPAAGVVVIDGLRSHAELQTFKDALGDDFLLVLVDCPDEVRITRVTGRGREDDTMTEGSFRERDRRELSWGLGEVLPAADIVIDNSGSIEELRDRVSELLDRLIK
jgi:dephospho-CoA kinase